MTTPCIETEHGLDAYGYGQMFVDGKVVKAHRVALARHQGIDLPPASVKCLHSCDNTRCINPEHLRWGTQQDNLNDAKRRDRFPKSKLTFNQRREIYAAEGTQRELAALYGVSQRVVWRIKNDTIYR